MITDITYRGYRLFAEAGDPDIDILFDGELIDSAPDIDTAKKTIDSWKEAR